MSRPAPRSLTVIRSQSVTPNMLRVTLGGAGMENFPTEQESAYVKLIFPLEGSPRGLMRTYTIRHQRPGEIDIDFVLHEEAGPASSWARQATPGESILIGGPGPRKMVNPRADWFLLIADMTALPALSVNLEELPADARGYAVIEVASEADIQPLAHPQGVHLHWLVNAHPGQSDQPLLEQVRQLPWLPGKAGVWAACEFSSMRALRRHFKENHSIDRDMYYISSYWKLGSSEDQHKVAKHEDAEQEQAIG